MELGLKDKVAVVTGASRGIGAAVVERLVAEGAQVAAVSRGAGSSRAAGSGVTTDRVRQVAADVSDASGCERAIAAAIEAFGRIDVLVNNAGGGARLGLAPFADLSDEDWDDALGVNLMAAVRMTRCALPWLTETRGAVVNVSSIGAHRVDGPPLAYNVAKAALTAFGRGVAGELSAQGIRMVTVTPGPTRTAMWDRFAEASGAPVEAVLASVPERMGMLTGRLIDPAEIAASIAYAASPLAASVVGSDLVIDGGALRGA